MGNITHISDFLVAKKAEQDEIDRLLNSSSYTCPKTGVKFPPIHRFQLPQCDSKRMVFNGTYAAHYQLSKEIRPSNAEMLGIAQGEPEAIRCLGPDSGVSIEIFHFSDDDESEGFFKAACYFLDEFDEIETFETENGQFLMVTRCEPGQREGSIKYVTYLREFIPVLGEEGEVMIVATFNENGGLELNP